MAAPVFGVAALSGSLPYPQSSVTITRGASDNFAIGGGYGDATGQTATYGGDTATAQTQVADAGGFDSRMFTRVSPLSGAQSWALTGGGTAFGPAVMTYSGVDLGSPIRGVESFTVSGSGDVTFDMAASPTADEIAVAYVAWSGGSSAITLTATGDTIIRAQSSNGSGYGVALLESPSGVFTFQRSGGFSAGASTAILTGEVSGGGGGAVYDVLTSTLG